jgi:hypothetical protein
MSSSPRFDRWQPELRRTLMRIQPEYFAWSVENQERYAVAMPAADREHLAEVLMAELFGRTFGSREESAAAADNLPLDELERWNQAVLPFTGIGEDHFFLNEWFADGKSILDFDTVRAYDEDDYHFQEAARTKDDPSYGGKPYRGSLYSSWARLYVEERFTYATLSMAAGYIYAQLENKGQGLLEERIPHRYVPGRHHGKPDGDNWQWDMRVDAGGQEGVLEELRRRVWDYQSARHEVLQTAWDAADRCGVYLVDESKPPESNLHVVFTDKAALSAVRFRSFLRDCRALERSVSELSRAVEEEQAALARFIEEQHADVLQTYDPKVRPLRKKRKVLVAKGAFSGLE